MSALKQLQQKAEDLAERLLIIELELKPGRNAERRRSAYHEFASVVHRVGLLRQDADDLLLSAGSLDRLLSNLDKRVKYVKGGQAYKIVAWLESAQVSWLVGPESVDPLRQMRPC
jgi:hypothetical protein